jgi:hypothetical protein
MGVTIHWVILLMLFTLKSADEIRQTHKPNEGEVERDEQARDGQVDPKTRAQDQHLTRASGEQPTLSLLHRVLEGS